MSTVITFHPTGSPRPAAGAGQLLRPVSPDAEFDWIEISGFTRSADALAAVRRVAEPVLSGSYEPIHTGEQAAPPFASEDSASSVLFVNAFRFAPESFDAAFDVWHRVNRYMVHKPGYRWHRLHRRSNADVPFGFVNIVAWESIAAWAAAHDEGLRTLLGPGPIPFSSVPTVCTPAPLFAGVERTG